MKYFLYTTLAVLMSVTGLTTHVYSATIQTQWAASCPLGWTDTELSDDTINTLHHLGEDKIQGSIQYLCVLSDDPAITLSTEWNPSSSCSAGYSFIGIYDDLGSWSQIDDQPTRHNLGENNYRPNGSNDNVWCMRASAPGNAYVSYRWPVWNVSNTTGPGCNANETRIAESHNFFHNVNFGDNVGANQESLCLMLVNDGVCGSANGVPAGAAPSTGLCAIGAASAVSGSGPWTWSCSGTNGGSAASCSAPTIPNTAPNAPTITGPTSANTSATLSYTFTATDPDNDTVRYGADWDLNGTVDEWIPASGYVSSGTGSNTTHVWGSDGSHTFQARTQDSKGSTSGWTSYTTTTSTPPPAPVALLTASPSSISAGGNSTLTYTCSNATSATISGIGAVSPATGGSVTVSPPTSTTYTLTCTNASGTVTDSVVLTVTPAGPVALSCTVSPPSLPSSGGRATWTVTPSGGATGPYTWTPIGFSGYTSASPTSVYHDFVAADAGQSYSMHVSSASVPTGIDCTPQVSVGSVCSGAPTGTITANPNRVRQGTGATISVSPVQNVQGQCVVSGPGVNQIIPASACTTSSVGSISTGPINTQSVYKLICDGTKVGEAIVNILPNFREF